MASKHDLSGHFETLSGDEWHATFEQVEAAFAHDDGLPRTARDRTQWWYGHDRPHIRAWEAGGWRTKQVNLERGSVVFERLDADTAAAAARTQPVRRPTRPDRRRQPRRETGIASIHDSAEMVLAGHRFRRVAAITPRTDGNGKIEEYMPQERYAKAATTRLNPHGDGPFCCFSIPGLRDERAVYAVTIDEQLVYVGITTASLRQRWGSRGYARIQPKNCYVGGQPTNCKVNHRILRAAREGRAIHLWTQPNEDPGRVEKALIAKLRPPWNDRA